MYTYFSLIRIKKVGFDFLVHSFEHVLKVFAKKVRDYLSVDILIFLFNFFDSHYILDLVLIALNFFCLLVYNDAPFVLVYPWHIKQSPHFFSQTLNLMDQVKHELEYIAFSGFGKKYVFFHFFVNLIVEYLKSFLEFLLLFLSPHTFFFIGNAVQKFTFKHLYLFMS